MERHVLPDRLVCRSVLVAAFADAVQEQPRDPAKKQYDAEQRQGAVEQHVAYHILDGCLVTCFRLVS